MRHIIEGVRWARKPVSFDEVEPTFIPQRVREAISGLPVVSVPDHVGPFTDLLEAVPMLPIDPSVTTVFVLERGDERFLVNTSGYGYCRYVARVGES